MNEHQSAEHVWDYHPFTIAEFAFESREEMVSLRLLNLEVKKLVAAAAHHVWDEGLFLRKWKIMRSFTLQKLCSSIKLTKLQPDKKLDFQPFVGHGLPQFKPPEQMVRITITQQCRSALSMNRIVRSAINHS